jgi:hypothetical protein
MERKGLIAGIYEGKRNGNCSNGGISERHKAVVVVDEKLPEIFSASSDHPAVKIVRRVIGGEPYIHAEPIDPVPDGMIGYMFGGSFIYTSDSRFGELSKYPIPLHDRWETMEQYDRLRS